MYRFYTPLLLLQAFCIYHAYRNGADQRWYWFILLFPGIGSAFYLFHHYYNRNNINSIAESVKEVVNSNYKIEQLEKAFRFSDNLKNRINLADAYVSLQRYDEAIKLYLDGLTGIMADDPGIRLKLLDAYFLSKNYGQVLVIGRELEHEKSFRNSLQRISYAWAFHFENQPEAAEKVFRDLNKSHTNFIHRIEYCKYLQAVSMADEFKSVLEDLIEEFEHMQGPQRRLHRDTIRAARQLYAAHTTR